MLAGSAERDHEWLLVLDSAQIFQHPLVADVRAGIALTMFLAANAGGDITSANLLMSESPPALDAGRDIRSLIDAGLIEEERAIPQHLTVLGVAHTHCFLSNLHEKRANQKRRRGGPFQSNATVLQRDRKAIQSHVRLSGCQVVTGHALSSSQAYLANILGASSAFGRGDLSSPTLYTGCQSEGFWTCRTRYHAR